MVEFGSRLWAVAHTHAERHMAEETSIQVHFGRPMPLFALDTPVLLPQQVAPLHIFEPRYIQMIEHALDSAGQIAVGVFHGAGWKQQYHGRPAVRPAVCVGQIVHHQKLDEGRYNIALHGVCRASIISEVPPAEGRHYREVMLEPVGLEEPDPSALADVRGRLETMLSHGPLEHLANAQTLVQHLRDEEIPTQILIEVLGFSMIAAPETRYSLLAEADVNIRAEIVTRELDGLGEVIRKALHQHPERWPKGVSWN